MIFGIVTMMLVGASWTIYGSIMGKAPKEQLKVSVLLFWTQMTALIISIVCGVFQGLPETTGRGLMIALGSQFLCGLFNFWQLELMSRAMQTGHNGATWSIVQSGFIFPFFMGIVFFNVPLTWMRGTALLLAISSVALTGCTRGPGAGKWLLPAFAGFLMTGCSQSLSNIPSYFPEAENVSSVWRTAALSLGFVAGSFSCSITAIPKFCSELLAGMRSGKLWKYVLQMQGINILGSYFLLYPGMDALSRASAGAIAYPLMVSSCLLVFDLYSLLILREKHSPMQWAALGLCISAVVGLTL